MTNLFDYMNPEWRSLLDDISGRKIIDRIFKTLEKRRSAGATIFPEQDKIFRAFDFFRPLQTRVVILGQDPYAGEGQANGLAFSVNAGQDIPPSLRNIFIELREDLGIDRVKENGDLSGWAEQGVLLLNSILTVEKSAPTSHAGFGWEKLTNTIVHRLSHSVDGLIFVLWGNQAQSKAKYLSDNSIIISAAHPSPLSAPSGFFGSNPFTKINLYLDKQGKSEIDWSR